MVEKFKYFCLLLVNVTKKKSGKYLVNVEVGRINATAHERKEIPVDAKRSKLWLGFLVQSVKKYFKNWRKIKFLAVKKVFKSVFYCVRGSCPNPGESLNFQSSKQVIPTLKI